MPSSDRICYGATREEDLSHGRGDQTLSSVTVWRALAVLHEGRKLYGSYAYLADEGTVQVRTPNGEKSRRVDGRTPDSLARSLLIELANEGSA